MKQYVLAIHNYHDTEGTLPAAATTLARHNRWSTHAALFPYYEQGARYDALVSAGETGTVDSTQNNEHTRHANGVISALLCPSDPTATQPAWQHATNAAYGLTAKCNIMTSRGDGIYTCDNPTNTAYYGSIGCLNRGLFFWHIYRPMSFATDGTSNTIAISEAVTADSWHTKNVKGGTIPNAGSCDNAGTDRINNCIMKRAGNEITESAFGFEDEGRGVRFSDGRTLFTGFHTVHPPNYPACGMDVSSNSQAGIFTPTSYHTGGVNSGFLDGSIRFISEVIDFGPTHLPAGQTRARQVNSGMSQFGVWGAMGTPEAGD